MDLEENLNKIKEIDVSKIANNILDIGLKAVLPDFIENDVIEIKNVFISEGFLEGIQEALEKAEELGKSITGLLTGEFDTIEQIKRLIKTDGILDGISALLDKITKKLLDNNKISKTTYNLIKSGKKEILSILKDELKSTYTENTYSMEKLDTECEEWKESYKNLDYQAMEKSSKKIKGRLEKSKIVENTINKARNIEKVQKYIEKRGSIDKLTESEKAVLEKIK